MPKEIVTSVKSDFNGKLEDYQIDMGFTCDIKQVNKMYYVLLNDILYIRIPPKNLLYLVNEFVSYDKIRDAVLNYFLYNICFKDMTYMKVYYLVKIERIKLELTSFFTEEVPIVVTNMNYLISAIRERAAQPQRYTTLAYREVFNILNWFRKDILFYEILGFTQADMRVFKKLCWKQDKALTEKTLCINGKKRKIILYKGTSEGYELRMVHNLLVERLSSLIIVNDHSYAYINGKSIRDCVACHINSFYFLKLDIVKFFNSISKRKMNKIIKMLLSNNGYDMYEDNLNGRSTDYKNDIIGAWEGVERIVELCFFKERLPLGLVSSPFLSNLYMDFFDKRFVKQYPNLIYTRYSDDILISSNKKFDSEAVKQFIISELEMLELNINLEKTHEYGIKNIGDHVKFLGLNIVKGSDSTYITVGRKYIKDTCKNVCEYLNNNGELDLSQVVGQIEYIKFISHKDYIEFEKIYHIKSGRNFAMEDLKKHRKKII